MILNHPIRLNPIIYRVYALLEGTMQQINVNEMINNSKLTGFHWRVIILSTLIIIFDGYDLVIYGVALPLLMKEWAIDPVTAGFIGSIALFGMMFGALIFGTIADKLEHLGVSRKKVIITCIVFFLCTRQK